MFLGKHDIEMFLLLYFTFLFVSISLLSNSQQFFSSSVVTIAILFFLPGLASCELLRWEYPAYASV